MTTIQCRALSDPSDGATSSSTPPPIQATVPACHTSRIRVRRLLRLDLGAGEYLGFAEHAMDDGDENTGDAGALQDDIAHRGSVPYSTVWYMDPALAAVNTGVYGETWQ